MNEHLDNEPTDLAEEIGVRYDGRFRLLDLVEEEPAAVIIDYHGAAIVALPMLLDDDRAHIELRLYLNGHQAYVPGDGDDEGTAGVDFLLIAP